MMADKAGIGGKPPLLALVMLSAIVASPSLAGNSRRAASDAPAITVPSQYDPTTTISAPVRHLPHGDQVRLPGGAWVWCEINCFHTLRNATIDFWRRYDAPPQ